MEPARSIQWNRPGPSHLQRLLRRVWCWSTQHTPNSPRAIMADTLTQQLVETMVFNSIESCMAQTGNKRWNPKPGQPQPNIATVTGVATHMLMEGISSRAKFTVSDHVKRLKTLKGCDPITTQDKKALNSLLSQLAHNYPKVISRGVVEQTPGDKRQGATTYIILATPLF
jgi:hypothetical protein